MRLTLNYAGPRIHYLLVLFVQKSIFAHNLPIHSRLMARAFIANSHFSVYISMYSHLASVEFRVELFCTL